MCVYYPVKGELSFFIRVDLAYDWSDVFLTFVDLNIVFPIELLFEVMVSCKERDSLLLIGYRNF